MSWARVQAAIKCWFCDQAIAVGEPAHFSQVTTAVRCVACAAPLGLTPPEDLASAPAPLQLPPPPEHVDEQPNLFEQPLGRGADAYVAREAIEQARQALTRGGER